MFGMDIKIQVIWGFLLCGSLQAPSLPALGRTKVLCSALKEVYISLPTPSTSLTLLIGSSIIHHLSALPKTQNYTHIDILPNQTAFSFLSTATWDWAPDFSLVISTEKREICFFKFQYGSFLQQKKLDWIII